MNIKVWKNYSKRINSTAIPSGGTDVSVQLKDNCSIETPSFILGIDTDINYVQAFGRYYRVSNVTILDANRMMIDCNVDVLASFRDSIRNTSALVRRSSSNYDTTIKDEYVSITSNQISKEYTISTMPFSANGCFLLSVGNDESSGNGIATYIIDAGGLSTFHDWLNGGGQYGQGTTFNDITNFMITQFGDNFSCIRYLKWIPLNYSGNILTEVAQQNPIRVGKYNVMDSNGASLTGWKLRANPVYSNVGTASLSDLIGTDFRRVAPYTSIDMYLPYYGLTNIPVDIATNELQIEFNIDFSTGDIHICVYSTGTDKARMISSLNYNCAVEIPISQSGRIASGIVSSGLGLIGDLMTMNPLGVASSSMNIVSAVASNGLTMKGSTDGRAMNTINSIMFYVTAMTTTNPSDLTPVLGRPCEQVLALSSLSGYVQTHNASVSAPATEGEIQNINAMLDSGIFLV